MQHIGKAKITSIKEIMAERQGFEPWVGLHPQRFSRPPRSTTPAPLRGGLGVASFKVIFGHAQGAKAQIFEERR